MAVIKDVAKKAGVSVGTVSKYLNRPDQLRQSTRERVSDAIMELRYRPNPLARSMRTGRTNLIAVFVPEISNPFYAEACSEVLARARTMGLTAMIVTTDDNAQLDEDAQVLTLVNQVDGIILLLLDNTLCERLALLFQRQKHTIVVSQRYEPLTLNSISIEERQGMFSAAKHIAALGRKKIAFIGGPQGDCMTTYKINGILDALSEEGLSLKTQICADGFSHRDGYLAAKELYEQQKELDAILCANDALAIGCMKFLQREGIQIGVDIVVTGFDNIPLSSLSTPELTTVALPLTDIAERALNVLVERMSENDFVTKCRLILPCTLLIRNSTDPNSFCDESSY